MQQVHEDGSWMIANIRYVVTDLSKLAKKPQTQEELEALVKECTSRLSAVGLTLESMSVHASPLTRDVVYVAAVLEDNCAPLFLAADEWKTDGQLTAVLERAALFRDYNAADLTGAFFAAQVMTWRLANRAVEDWTYRKKE